MKFLLKKLVGKITVYLMTFSLTFIPCIASLGTTKVYASESSYENAEKELDGVMEESLAVIADKKRSGPLDEEPPMIMHDPLQATGKRDLRILATIEDGTEVKKATLYYRIKGNVRFEDVKMKKVEGSTYIGIIPEDEVSFAGMEYYIEASDLNNNIATDGSEEIVYAIAIEGAPVAREKVQKGKAWYKSWWVLGLAAVVAGGIAAAAGGGGGSDGGNGSGTGTVTGIW